MTMLFADPCGDSYVLADRLLRWTSESQTGGYSIGAYGRNSSNGWRVNISNVSYPYLKKVLGAGHATCIWGMAFKFRGASGNGYGAQIVTFGESGTVHVDLRINSSNVLYVTRAGTTLATGTTPLVQDVWYYVEFKATINDSTGSVYVRLNGVSEISATSQDTRNGGTSGLVNEVYLGGPSSVVNNTLYFDVDDIVVCDGAGSVNNDFLGDCRVECLVPSAGGNSTNWTPSTGSNYDCVNEAQPNGDTDYVSTATATTKDTYAFGDLGATTGAVKAVQTVLVARKDDAGSRSIAPVVRHSSTDYDGTTVSVSDSYAHLTEIKETNPGTSSAWSVSDVNGAEFGVKLVS